MAAFNMLRPGNLHQILISPRLALERITHPHGKCSWTVWEGAVVFEQLQVHLADVVLQVEGGGEIRLAARLWAHQYGFV